VQVKLFKILLKIYGNMQIMCISYFERDSHMTINLF